MFSDKVTQVDVQVSPLFEDTALVSDWLKEAILKAILTKGDIPAHLMNGLTQSNSVKVRKFYRWVKDNYVYGLPDASVAANTDNTDIMRNILNSRVESAVTIEYCFLDRINNVHVGWQKLSQEYQYDYTTNEIKKLSNEVGYPVYLKDILSIHPEEEPTSPQYDPTGGQARKGVTEESPLTVTFGLNEFRQAGGVITDPTRTTEAVKLVATYQEEIPPEVPEGVPTYVTRYIERTWELTPYTTETLYHQVMYRYVRAGKTQYGWWTYQDGAGTYPALDELNKVYYKNPGTFFPFLFFRMDKKDLTASEHHNTREYKDTKKALSLLGLDYDNLGTSIHENPDIKDVLQAALVFGIPMNTKKKEGLLYLFEFFRRQAITKPSAIRVLPGQRKDTEAILIQDSKFKQALGYHQITWEKTAGRTGDIGEVTSHTSTTKLPVYYEKGEYIGGGDYTTVTGVEEVDAYTWVYRRQINDVFYEEVRVVSPSLTYHIDGVYTATAIKEADQLLIPLDMSLCDYHPDRHQESLYLQSMHLVFVAKVVTKLKWYESSFFRAVITIAAVVIVISTGQGQFAAWAAAFAAGGLSALALAVLVSVVKAIALSALMDAAVKELGMENALILAAVAFVISIYTGDMGSSVDSAPWAVDMLQVATGLADAVSSYASELIGEYQAEAQAFNLMAEEKWAELAEIEKSLDTSGLLDPFTFVGKKPITILGETPESFYNRTIHAGNIGTLAFDAINHHVENALRLPTINDTLGGLI